MKIMVTGANGLLGQHLVKQLLANPTYTVLATGRGNSRLPFAQQEQYHYYPLDITDGIAVNQFIRLHQPQVLIHAAAMTQPDPCELDTIACWEVNVTATRFLLDAAAETAARFIYLSTDFVFDGENGPYSEAAVPNPVNYYGSSKLAAEKSVMQYRHPWAIVRTVLVYGNVLVGNRSNIVSWVIDNLSQQKPINVVNDQWRTPTFVNDLVAGVLLLLAKEETGIYHISGADFLTPYQMALAVAQYKALDAGLITPVTAATFTQPARRPLRTGFIINKARTQLGYAPMQFATSLAAMLG
jgi:dTDP-4-dehydrorhamnose reductase